MPDGGPTGTTTVSPIAGSGLVICKDHFFGSRARMALLGRGLFGNRHRCARSISSRKGSCAEVSAGPRAPRSLPLRANRGQELGMRGGYEHVVTIMG